MAIEQMNVTSQETKDNLGAIDTNKDLILLRNKESIFVEEGAMVFETQLIDNSFILGNASNGILGTSTLGAGGAGSYARYAVVNANNTWHEHFRDTEFQDTTNTTCNWDTTNFRAEFGPGDQLQTNAIFYNNEQLSAVNITLTKTGLKVKTQIDINASPGGKEVNLT